MAAATQIPAGTWPSKTWVTELAENVQKAVDLGIVANGSETVTTLLANLATEAAAR